MTPGPGPSRTGMTIGEIDPRYGDPSATPPPWPDIERLLTGAQLYWIVTVRTDGRPHAVPLVGVWHDGAFAFCTGAEEQKQRNLDANPSVAVTTGSTGAGGWSTGTDVVVEGTAVRVTDQARLRELAALWKSKLDWDFTVGDGEFRDPDGRHGLVFGVTPTKVLSFGKGEPFSQTRYRFPA
jgi:general stress protein 26